MIFIKEEVCTHISLETGGTAWHTGHMEWNWVQSEGRGSPRQTEAGGAFIVVFIRKNGYRGVSRFRIGWFEKCQMNASQ